MSKVVLILTIILLISLPISSIAVQSFSTNSSIVQENEYGHTTNRKIGRLNKIFNNQDIFSNHLNKRFLSTFSFFPEDITLKDDAFHGANSIQYTEWWYFDAIFDNGYSIQIGIRVLGVLNQGVVFLKLDIYKEGELVSHETKIFFIWDFFTSEEVPLVELKRNKIMEGRIREDNGRWEYNLSVILDDSSAELCFVGCTKGWKGKTPGGNWAVILPKAEVIGSITHGDTIVNVSGIGYHDHNWNVSLLTGINFGWFWGKVNSNSYTLTWAKIMTTRFWGQPLLVINEKYGDYINIEPEYINLQIKDFQIRKGMIVPYTFIIDVEKENIYIHIVMEVTNIHHVRWMGIINYWRYHFKCTGIITVKGESEYIDEMEIAEYIRFR